MGGHIPVKNKRARENSVSRARFIFSGGNILPPFIRAPGKAFVYRQRPGGGPTRCTMQKAAGIDSNKEGIPPKKITLGGQKSR